MSFHDDMVQKYGLKHLPEDWVYKPTKQWNKSIKYGVGVTDVEFAAAGHPAYKIWHHILERSFSNLYKETRPTYKDVTCCEDWWIFSTFLIWWNNNYVHKYTLDKDILFRDNKVYSPNTCIFVPQHINSFLGMVKISKSGLPLGVSKNKNNYLGRLYTNGSNNNLGTFKDPMQAHRAWQIAKAEIAKSYILEFPYMEIVYKRLIYDIENNLETFVI